MKFSRLKLIISVSAFTIVSAPITIFAAEKSYSMEEIQNRRPGFSEADKEKSQVSVGSYINTFSNADGIKIEDDKSDKKSEKESLAYSFDQVVSLEESSIVGTWKIYGTNDSWVKNTENKWILLENQVPAVGWRYVNSNWYYMNSLGVMQTGWINHNGKWYYLNSNGSMAYSTWVDGYYLDSTGVMR